MPVIRFTSRTELVGHLQAALVESVDTISEVIAGGEAESLLSAVCLDYAAANTLAKAGWWLTEEIPLWWTEVVTADEDRLCEAEQFLNSRDLQEAMVCAFYAQDESAALVRRLALLSEDEHLSAKFRILFDH